MISQCMINLLMMQLLFLKWITSEILEAIVKDYLCKNHMNFVSSLAKNAKSKFYYRKHGNILTNKDGKLLPNRPNILNDLSR